jgi:hypothetical protein
MRRCELQGRPKCREGYTLANNGAATNNSNHVWRGSWDGIITFLHHKLELLSRQIRQRAHMERRTCEAFSHERLFDI